jgi:hypothetical protein
MPGMQMVIFRETLVAVTILAPRPRVWRNVREPCSIEQSDEKYRFKRGRVLNRYPNFHPALDLGPASRLDVPLRAAVKGVKGTIGSHPVEAKDVESAVL